MVPYVAAQLRDGLRTSGLVRSVKVLESIDSTNSEARRMGRSGAPGGSLVIADQQTAGRGRRQRVWESPAHTGIYLSLLLRPRPVDDTRYATGLQLGAGIAIAEALAPLLAVPVELVWPNDVFSAGLKLAGVLVEAETLGRGVEFFVCGIGVNVNQRREDFPEDLRAVAGSVRALGGAVHDRGALIVRLLHGLANWEEVARAGDLEPLVARFEALSPTSTGSQVEVQTVDGVVRGDADGLSPVGGLRVRCGDTLHEVVVGELIRARSKR